MVLCTIKSRFPNIETDSFFYNLEGMDVFRDPFKERMENARRMGVVFGQKTQLWWDIPVEETFHLLKNIYEIPKEKYEKNIEKFKDILGLEEFMDQPARKLSLGRICLFFLSLFLGQGVKFSIQYLFSLLCFYTDNAYGVTKAREVLSDFFSGALVPLAMFPGISRNIVKLFPFQGIVFIPCSIFIGTFTITEAVKGICVQAGWIAGLGICGTLFWRKASAVISLYGG